jgi:biotin carboxyl carrier protein
VSDTDGDALRVIPLGGGRYLLEDDGRRRLGFAAAAKASTWVFLDGRVAEVGRVPQSRPGETGRIRPSGPVGDESLSAPMPATVVRINVAPGQRVARGDVLILLEAMKMELPLTSPRAGAVAAIRCRPGELVQPGVPLVELE